jgi:hypothetical protein
MSWISKAQATQGKYGRESFSSLGTRISLFYRKRTIGI